MRPFNTPAIVSVVLWALMLWTTVEHVYRLTEESPESLNPARLAFYLGVPITMILLTVGSTVWMALVERTAGSIEADYSNRLGCIPVICLLLFLPYLLMLFIGG